VSLDVQAARIRAYCKTKGWALLEIIRDEGRSARDLNRPGIARVLELARKRNGSRTCDVVVVLKLDRLTRSVKDLGISLFLMIYRYEMAWQYALLGALWAVGLAVIAWVLWTLFEVLVLIGGLGILVARAIQGAVHAGRATARWALLPAGLLLALPMPATGQIPVIDAANLVQNTTRLAGLWDTEALPRLQRLGQIIQEGQAIAYQTASIDGEF
jgi:hypothetical protein